MFGSSYRSQRHSASSVSPFRSRKSQAPKPHASKGPLTSSSASSSRFPSSHATAPAAPTSTSSGVRPLPVYSTVPEQAESCKIKENVTVTVRFRPLSPREINKGDEIAWYADGDSIVRNEHNPSVSYGFDRVFGPATTTRHVYDVAAEHIISGAMKGINGTVFAYGVTSSGKTHTMHGEQKSPGVIPLAVKDVFGIIQETPGREFLLRVSYLEIYNEVINDLLDPTRQNLKIREDAEGTYVEGIKEEVVLSPAHVLSLIAAGEEHRHVGSNNINLLSSRSHTIFTLSHFMSASGENEGEDVTLSQLHLIDLAGSESSKTETTGLRRKEGSYINKSLLTLGTVICTVTPALSNSEETHNTLKFAHRSKHVEVKASQNMIMDEKSLIKKYQKEISSLKEELNQLKRGMMGNSYTNSSAEEEYVNLKLQLEAGQVKLQSRLEEEEEAKAALMGRIQRLTKLILVSTKNSMSTNIPDRPSYHRRHSFREDELAYLPDRRGKNEISDGGNYASGPSFGRMDEKSYLADLVKDFKRNRRHEMFGWFKVKKPGNLLRVPKISDGESSSKGLPASCSKLCHDGASSMNEGRKKSVSQSGVVSSMVDSFPERTQAGELFGAAFKGCHVSSTHDTIIDQVDLLREQVKMLAGEIALSTSSLKRLFEQGTNNPDDLKLKVQIQNLKDDINEKKHQMQVLEQLMIESLGMTSRASKMVEINEALSKLTTQLNERSFQLQLMTADNRILQEQLQKKWPQLLISRTGLAIGNCNDHRPSCHGKKAPPQDTRAQDAIEGQDLGGRSQLAGRSH
ncbi:hypothetical protein SAY87_000171 [Trapa incisa]|uniref:Kinesin-like protein n=1 Tax=Trapa incisa TaxID=236973 RepID=A0AAN7GGA9_9MYRT|nr:hypothetical protein SAY87_000171 [Trapa incisa]